MKPRKYLVILEWAGSNYSSYAPDLPGCVSTGKTQEECLRNMGEAIALHLEGMEEDGDPIPEPTSIGGYVEVGGRVEAVA